MNPDFWHSRWAGGQIGFHQSSVDRSLAEFWPSLGLPPSSRVFVPLCGKSLDLLWLRARGHDVIGVEISEVAVEAFCVENGIPARRRKLPNFDSFETARLQILRGDLFALTPEVLGPVAAVYDRAALISWEPRLRDAYVDQMTAITQRGTSTFLAVLEYQDGQGSGPPFSVGPGEVARLYSKGFSIRELARRDVSAEEPKLRARGISPVFEVCYLLERR